MDKEKVSDNPSRINANSYARTNTKPLCLEHFFDYIECAVTGEDVTNGKPNPECYLKVSDKLKVEPSRCLVFEDICMGLKAGISAGMKTVAVYDDFSASQWQDKKAMSDYYIDSYDELV